ncbi:B-cell lymphoma 3 protein homolog isoform X2 [Lycorma delicatula]|uniref:B-cell lymphoma 3 protein homolog isoform X2 n=1 Tax=Lycorma delicatula TaxID=130591 RepID=UPI003F514AD0
MAAITAIIKMKYINKKNEAGWTALMYACFHSHENIVHYLIQNSASIKILNKKKQSALMIASHKNNINILQQLYVEEFINSTDEEGFSPLYYAVVYGCKDSVKWLLEHNANPNHVETETGNSLLMIAVMTHQVNIVQLLLKYKANLDVINKNNETATKLAMKLGHYKIAMLMEAHRGENSLQKILENLSLEKYWPLMEENNIDLSKFLSMNEDDIKEIGIKLLGPRKKMGIVIAEMNAQLMQSICYQMEAD